MHRLNVFVERGVRVQTTNLIESVMARLEAKTPRVTRDQQLRWCAAARWATERQFRRAKNHRHLRLLQQAFVGNVRLTKSAAV